MKKKILLTFALLIPLVFFFGSVSPVFADEIQESVENNEDFSNAYKELIDDYDSEAMEFDCGRFDLYCNVYNLTFQVVVSGMNFTLDQMYSTIIEPDDITGNSTFTLYQSGVSSLSYTLFAIFIAFSMAKIISLRMADASDGAVVMNEKIVSIVVIGIFLLIYDQFIRWVLQLQQAVVTGILDTFDRQDFTEQLVEMFLISTDFGIILLFVFMVLAIVFTFQLFYRLALIALLYMVGPVAITTKMNDNYNFFDFWLKHIINAFLSYALQVLCAVIGLQTLVDGNLGSTNIFIGLAFFFLAVSIPTLLGSFGFSTGTGRQVTNIGKSAGRMVLRR